MSILYSTYFGGSDHDFVTGLAVVWVARGRPTGDAMQIDTAVLGHDVRYFAIAYALAIGAAFLPLEPVWLTATHTSPSRSRRACRCCT